MKIECPHCNYTKEIDPAAIPPNAKSATCPNCGQKFRLPTAGAATSPDLEEPVLEPVADAHGGLASEIEAASAEFEAGRQGEAAAPPPIPPTPPAGPPVQPQPGGPRAQPQPARPALPLDPIPWEVRKGSLFGDLWETWKTVLFNPNHFFDRAAAHREGTGYLSYGVIMSAIGLVFSFLLYFVLFLVTAGMASDGGPGMGIVVGIFGGLVILSPLFALVWLYVGAGIMHLFFMIVGGANNGFQTTLRMLCYCSSPLVANIVPYIGGMAGGIYYMVLMILGAPKLHDTTVGKAVVAVIVLPIALAFALTFVLGIAAAIIIPMIAGGFH